jgi:hypothetical protein
MIFLRSLKKNAGVQMVPQYDNQRVEMIRQTIRDFARLVEQHPGDGSKPSHQEEQMLGQLTELVQDAQVSAGIERALRDLWQVQYARYRWFPHEISLSYDHEEYIG